MGGGGGGGGGRRGWWEVTSATMRWSYEGGRRASRKVAMPPPPSEPGPSAATAAPPPLHRCPGTVPRRAGVDAAARAAAPAHAHARVRALLAAARSARPSPSPPRAAIGAAGLRPPSLLSAWVLAASEPRLSIGQWKGISCHPHARSREGRGYIALSRGGRLGPAEAVGAAEWGGHTAFQGSVPVLPKAKLCAVTVGSPMTELASAPLPTASSAIFSRTWRSLRVWAL